MQAEYLDLNSLREQLVSDGEDVYECDWDSLQRRKRRRGNESNLALLPVEVLSIIATKLEEPTDRMALAETCVLLRAVVVRVRWENAAAALIEIKSDNWDEALLTYGGSTSRISFPENARINLALVLPQLRNLVSIDFGGLEQFSVLDNHIRLLLENCHQIAHLFLSDCVCCTDESLLSLSQYQNVSYFKSLNFDRCCEMSDAGLIPLLQKTPLLQLLSLNLVPLATKALTEVIASNCSKLEVLGLSDTEALSDDALVQIARGCARITSLDLSECVGISEEGLIQFAMERELAGSPVGGFRKLILGSTPAVTDASLYALLTNGQNLSSVQIWSNDQSRPRQCLLQTLDLSSAANISIRSLECLPNCITSNLLTTLNLNHAVILEEDSLSRVGAALAELFKSQQSLETIQMMGGVSGAVQDAVLQSIATHCRSRLETLDLSECHGITDAGAQPIAQYCSKLSNVNFKACVNLTDETIHGFLPTDEESEFVTTSAGPLMPRKRHLRYLNMGLCNKISNASAIQTLSLLCKSSSSPSEGLHTLKLSGCFNISDESLTSISNAIISSTPPQTCSKGSLRLLCFSGCYKLSSPAITDLTNLLPYLESINLYSCPSVTNETVTQIARTCPRLLSLVISKCPVGDVAALSIAQHCQNLHTLYMSFLTAPIGQDATSGGACSHLTDVGVSSLIDGCTSLKLMDLSRCDALTDAAFSCSNWALGLQVLLVRACPLLSFEGMERLVGRSPRLLTLDVLGCAKFSVVDRERLKELVER